MLRLASMNAANKKNMISINGMISIRAFLWGNGEPIFTSDLSGRRGPASGMGASVLAPEFHRVEALRLGGGNHDLDVGGGRFQFELQLGEFAGEIVERNQGENGDGQAAHR